MATTDKSNKSSIGKKRVKLGATANVFHDQTTGITVSKGEVVELNYHQLNSKRIKSALAGGHLVYTNDEMDKFEKEESKENLIEKLRIKSKKLFEKGVDPVKASDGFTLEELKMLAKDHEIEVDNDDTKATIMTAIFEDLSDNNGE